MSLGAVHRGRLRGTKFFINLDKTFLNVVSLILFNGGFNALVVAEEVKYLGVAAHSEGADKGGYGKLAVFVDAHIENVVNIGFIFQPRASVGDNGGRIKLLTGFVVIHFIVNARRTNELRNDNALGAVDYKGAARSHQRKITHKDVALFNFARRFIQQAGGHAQRGGIGRVSDLTFNYAVVGAVNIEGIVDEVKHKVVLIIGDSRNILEYFLKTFLKEPAVGFLLHLNEIRHINDFINFTEAHSLGVAKLYGFDINHRRITP